MNVLKELQKITKSLENIEFDRYCKQCGKRSKDCKCGMTGLNWMAYNKDMRAYLLANKPLDSTAEKRGESA